MEFLRQYEILFKKARTDLKVAKNILEDFDSGIVKTIELYLGKYKI